MGIIYYLVFEVRSLNTEQLRAASILSAGAIGSSASTCRSSPSTLPLLHRETTNAPYKKVASRRRRFVFELCLFSAVELDGPFSSAPNCVNRKGQRTPLLGQCILFCLFTTCRPESP